MIAQGVHGTLFEDIHTAVFDLFTDHWMDECRARGSQNDLVVAGGQTVSVEKYGISSRDHQGISVSEMDTSATVGFTCK